MTTQAIITVLTKGKGGKAVANTAHIEKVVEQERQALARINKNYSDTERKNNLDYRYKPENSTLQLRDFQNQVLEARKSLLSDLRRGGNVAVAEIHIDGLDIKKMAAHSQIRQAKNGFVGNANTRFESETIANKKGRDIDRKVDSEYKILANLADKLNNNPNA